MRTLTIMVMVIFSVLIAACGGSGRDSSVVDVQEPTFVQTEGVFGNDPEKNLETSEGQEIKFLITEGLRLFQDGDFALFRILTTSAFQEACPLWVLEQKSLLIPGLFPDQQNILFVDLTFEGNSATISYNLSQDLSTMNVRKENGQWLLEPDDDQCDIPTPEPTPVDFSAHHFSVLKLDSFGPVDLIYSIGATVSFTVVNSDDRGYEFEARVSYVRKQDHYRGNGNCRTENDGGVYYVNPGETTLTCEFSALFGGYFKPREEILAGITNFEIYISSIEGWGIPEETTNAIVADRFEREKQVAEDVIRNEVFPRFRVADFSYWDSKSPRWTSGVYGSTIVGCEQSEITNIELTDSIVEEFYSKVPQDYLFYDITFAPSCFHQDEEITVLQATIIVYRDMFWEAMLFGVR